MGKKYKVRLSEQELIDLITKQVTGKDAGDIIKDYIKKALNPSSTSTNNDDYSSSPIITSGDDFTQLDLNTKEGYDAYRQIADKYIDTRSSNLLNINGNMLADAAKNTFNKHKSYVPPELALAQLAAEGGFSSNPNARPIRTKNPFNVGNIDSGENKFDNTLEDGIDRYYNLIAKRYLTGDKTADDLLQDFINADGLRYAAEGYEKAIKKIIPKANSIANQVLGSTKVQAQEQA